MWNCFRALSLTAVMITTGCAAVSTKVTTSPSTVDAGLAYWMPRRDIKVTVVITDSVPSITITRTDAYAENRHGHQAYIASFRSNQLGTNYLKIGVNERGLLQSANAKYTSKLTETLQELASTEIKNLDSGPLKLDRKCPESATMTIIVRPEENFEPKAFPKFPGCEVSVTVTRLMPLGCPVKEGDTTGKLTEPCHIKIPDTAKAAGFFYKQEAASQVLVQVGDLSQVDLVFLPNDSPIRFLPIKKGLFANNEADFTFSDGSPTSYEQSVDSEFLGLLKLPANVIKAYFGAVGAMFTSKKSANEAEATYIAGVRSLELQQRKTSACMRALAAKNDAEIASLCVE